MGSASPSWYLAWDQDCWMAVQRPSRCPAAGWCRTILIVAQDYHMLESKSTCSSPSCWGEFGSPGGEPIVDGYPWWWHCQSVETSCLLSGKCLNLGFPELLTFLHCQTKVKTCWTLVVIHQVEVLVQLHVEFGWHNVWFELDTQCCLTIVEAEWLTCCRAKQFSIVDGHVVFWVVFFLAFACRISTTSSKKIVSCCQPMLTYPLFISLLLSNKMLNSEFQNLKYMLTCRKSLMLSKTNMFSQTSSIMLCTTCWGGKWGKRRYSESRLCWYTPCWSFNQVHGSKDVCRCART